MSTKTTVQPGRRTPLSLSGAVTKIQPNKGSNNVTNGGGVNANGHPAPSNIKQDNKLQQQKGDQPAVTNSDSMENPNKKQQPQAEKKQQNESKKSNEKVQSGANISNKPETNENKQQQQNKEKVQHQNGNDENKLSEKEKSDKLEKPKDKPEKDITKSKEDKKREQHMPQNKKDEKKTKESKDIKDDKKEVPSKSDANTEMQQQVKGDNNKSKVEDKEKVRSADKNKSAEKDEQMYIVEDQLTQKSSNSVTPKSNIKANRTSTPVTKTPTKVVEKTPQKSTATNTVKTTSPVYKRVETTAIDDNDMEMEALAVENSPVKSSQPEEAANIKIVPSATSTPGKILLPKRSSGIPKSDVQLAMQTERSPERPRMFSQISGRKSIRPISDYTPSKFQSNLQFRESYRRINTELDATNTSMNVTVGSEVASNFSFSFFGRGRKRDRASPTQHSQSAIGELQTDVEISPPKKARLDIHGILSAVSSPITLLRNRFSKASLQSSTPAKFQQNLNTDEDEIEVQNVSGVSVQEEFTTAGKESSEMNSSTDEIDATLGEEAKETKLSSIELHLEGKEFEEFSYEQSDIKITEAPFQSAVGDQMAKNKKCVVM